MAQATAMTDITWDEHYDNPDAKIILVSKDKVGFRIEAWYIKKKSAFVKDLLDLPSQQAIEDTPIELEHDSIVIRHFLQLITPHVMPGAELNWSQFMELFSLCDRLQAPEVEAPLVKAIRSKLQERPYPKGINVWAAFKLAGERDDPELARAALRALERNNFEWDALFARGILPPDLALTPFPYVAGLFLAAYSIRPGPLIGEKSISARSWDVIADNFKPAIVEDRQCGKDRKCMT